MSNIRKRNQNIIFLAVGILVLIMVMPNIMLGATNVVSGYDGVVSEVVGVHYVPDSPSDQTDIAYDGTSITIDEAYDNKAETNTPTGLRCSVSGGVGITETEEVNTVEGALLADGSREIWSVYEVKCTMGMSIRTVPQGHLAAVDVLFTIQLSENQFSIFSNADEQYAFIVAVSTISPPEVDKTGNGMMETDHMEGGKNFVLQPIATHEPPAWVEGAGYTGIMSNFATVNFDVNVIQAKPDIMPFKRTESEIVYDIEVDVIVFGYWEATQDTNSYENQANPDPFAWMGVFFSTMGEGLLDMLRAGYVAVFAIVVFGLIVLYFFFVARAGGKRGRGRPSK